MGCNANNHPPDCRCGWGGDGHKGRNFGGGRGYFGNHRQPYLKVDSAVETENHLTQCPICKSDVAFIKHNGGAVWLDLPLGPPWYKHACFDNASSSVGKNNLKSIFNIENKTLSRTAKIIVADSCSYNSFSSTSMLRAKFSNGIKRSMSVRGDARIFVGRICCIDESTKEIWPIDDVAKKLYFQGSLADIISKGKKTNSAQSSLKAKQNERKSCVDESSFKIECALCGKKMRKQKNYRAHLLREHGVALVSAGNNSSYMILDHDDYDKLSHEKLEPKSSDLGSEPSTITFSEWELRGILAEACDACSESSGWSNLANVGEWIKENEPGFKSWYQKEKKLSAFMEELGFLDLKKETLPDQISSRVIYIKIKG
ncbi:OST-HTH/LOTUS domain-containing protein [Vreelandella alkaliphila]|uniref:OST-HTH/LOTUS domain-containing protein n=1 Tax=Vreelandella alkaliphila TaxID=272774 RepID=A0AAJ2RRT6_9GAMM|nr:OST-HTH/LOTUS domain-containing protein [Halomonas alkaliphila]MDX5976221.1 OST-HTH/LOTUS domain-containing protein [Halomonas alkaliphila]